MRIATALLLITTFAPAARADEPRGPIRGKAYIAGSDRPAAGVTLHFFDRGAAGTRAVTHADGVFLCAVPAGVTIPAPQDRGEEGPQCWMEAQEPGRWTWQPIRFAPSLQPDYARKLAAESLMQPVKTTWRERAGRTTLEVACPPTGEVEVVVRGDGGVPLADRPVQVIPDEQAMEMHMPVHVRFDGRTDGAGRFRMRWFEGMNRLKVVVPGDGFGSTGRFAVRAGQVARQETPPLARLGSIEGRLDPKLAGPSTTVVLLDQGTHLAKAACDPEGRFALRDVLPGAYWLQLERAGQAAGHPTGVRVAPGHRVTGVMIGAEPPAPPRGAMDRFLEEHGPLPDRGKEVVWFEGTVRDEQGRGVAGAGVYARATTDGGMRMIVLTRSASTDGRGRYQVRGPRERMVDTPRVIAHAEGGPPALAYAPMPGADGRPTSLDLTLPDARRGGSVRLTVLEDGRPAAGVNVSLDPSDGDLSTYLQTIGVEHTENPAGDAVKALIRPTTVTDRDGVARFTGLLPGRYELTATRQGQTPAAPRPNDSGVVIVAVGASDRPEAPAAEMPEPAPVFARAEGLTVVEGRETAFAMAIHPQPCTAQVQVLRPDGTPLAGRTVALSFGLVTASSTTSLKLDDQGRGRYDFGSPGLWSIAVRFRDSGPDSFPIDAEPFDQAEALLPIAPGLTPKEPIRLLSVHRGFGSLRVRLLDADGRPARGTVETLEFLNQPDHAATTDEQGIVVFRGLPSGSYRLRGFIDGLTAPVPDPAGSSPLPEDSALRGRAVVPFATATVQPGRETTVELRARPAGYVRGTLRPPAGHKAAEYEVMPVLDWREVEAMQRLDPESGRFLHGPLPAGKVAYHFQQQAEDGTSQDAGAQTVEVPAGGVAHVDLRPEEPKPPPPPGSDRQSWLGMGGVRTRQSRPDPDVSTVVLDDGKTPAFAAEALLYVPGEVQPVSAGLSDATGRLAWHGLWTSSEAEDARRTGLVERPTAVVRIPGRTGAAIVEIEPGRPARVTLPAPRNAEGRVTLGGRPVDGRNARIRVVAAHEGRGLLDAALSLEATAQADGRFDLRGLTPSRYAVQAARDGIWLSRTIELTIGADKDPPPLDLDVPEPGAPVTLQIVDSAGHPVADQAIGLVRPEGPLASLWPASLRTDPTGTLSLRGLESGRHTLLIGDGKERRRGRSEVPARHRRGPGRPSSGSSARMRRSGELLLGPPRRGGRNGPFTQRSEASRANRDRPALDLDPDRDGRRAARCEIDPGQGVHRRGRPAGGGRHPPLLRPPFTRPDGRHRRRRSVPQRLAGAVHAGGYQGWAVGPAVLGRGP